MREPSIELIEEWEQTLDADLLHHLTRRQLMVTSRTGQLPVRYDAASDTSMDAWTRRLRRRTAVDPAPVPADYPGIRDVA
jgi:hypothetical protein